MAQAIEKAMNRPCCMHVRPRSSFCNDLRWIKSPGIMVTEDDQHLLYQNSSFLFHNVLTPVIPSYPKVHVVSE